MVRQKNSSRITPRGTKTDISVSEENSVVEGSSSALVPVVMFGCFLVGGIMILVNYLTETIDSDWYLIGGLGLILAGIITATKLR